MNVSYSLLCRIKDALDQVGVQDAYVDYDFDQRVKFEIHNLIDTRMKDHEFREAVNDLRDLVIEYKDTAQLRARLSTFLKEFKESVE